MAGVTFLLTRIPFASIAHHAKKNAGVTLPPAYERLPWIYLSNFYYASPHAPPQRGHATAVLKQALAAFQTPIILCCEPVLGSDPRSLNAHNCEWTAERRYDGLCAYYRDKFQLKSEIPIDCTLKTELSGHGAKGERKFMWGIQNLDGLNNPYPMITNNNGKQRYTSVCNLLDFYRPQTGAQRTVGDRC